MWSASLWVEVPEMLGHVQIKSNQGPTSAFPVYGEPTYKTGAWGAWEERFNCSLIGEETVTRQVVSYPGLTITYRESSKTLILIILPTMWCFTFSWLTMSIIKLIFNEFICKIRNISEYDRWIPAFGKAFSSQRIHLAIISKDSSCGFLVHLLHFCASSLTHFTHTPQMVLQIVQQLL